MKRILSIITMTLALSGAANAIDVQTLKLKNGSVLHGYVIKQDGAENVEFKSDNATICKSMKDGVTVTEPKTYKIKDLPKEWKDWSKVKENKEQLGGTEDEPTIDLCDVILPGNQRATQVRVLEQGANVIYYQATPSSYNVKWSDIESIRSKKRGSDVLSGIDVTYTLKDGQEYTGQYAGETYDTFSLFVEGKPMRSMNISDVVKQTYKAHNPDQDIFEQSPLLDFVSTTGGDTYSGVIIEKNFSSAKAAENYFIIDVKDDGQKRIPVSAINQVWKQENKDYKPIKDVILTKDQVMVNRKEAKYTGITEKNDVLTFEKCDSTVTLQQEKGKVLTVDVEYNSESADNAGLNTLVKVNVAKSKKKESWSFSYADMVKSSISPKTTAVSKNKTRKDTYDITSPGVYALYNKQTKKAVAFVVKQ